MLPDVNAPNALDEVHRRIRRGDFDESLLATVRQQAATWQAAPSIATQLKGTYVVAEVLDYFGQYAEEWHQLERVGPEQQDFVRKIAARQPLEEDLSLSKRRIWVTIAFAMALYRKEEYRDALSALVACRAATDALDPGREMLFGTRARIAHSHGQIRRQLHDYASARREFEDAIVFARRRFVGKTAFAELPHPSEPAGVFGSAAFEDDRLLAHWTVGKCLALGLGWIAYTTGQLSAAAMLLSAGYTLLRGTGDGLHRAYAKLLLGAVERAAAGDDPQRLAKAIETMEDAKMGLESHPTFKLRATYDLALAYYRLPRCRVDARRAIGELKAGLSGKGQRSARWMSTALAVESRIERLEGNLERAETLANRAVACAESAPPEHNAINAEALIALGEVFRDKALEARSHRSKKIDFSSDHAIDRFEKALALASDNPKIAAVCHLHLARTYCERDAIREAQIEYAAATAVTPIVEHGFVKALADTVAREIRIRNCFFVSADSPSLMRKQLVRDLEEYLLAQAKNRRKTLKEAAKLLGVALTTAKKIQHRASARNQSIGQRPVGVSSRIGAR
jgi:hypothetical protein